MAIGDIRAASGPEQSYVQDRSSQTLANIGQGVSAAINDFSAAYMQHENSTLELEKYYDTRQMASKNLAAETAFVEQQRKNAELFTTLSRDKSAAPLGLTNDYDAQVEASNVEFLKTLDPRLQEEYKNKLQVDKTNRRLSAFQTELSLLDESDKTQLTASLNVLGTAIKSGEASLEDAGGQWTEFVGKSGLPEDQKAALLLSGQQTLATLQFSNDVGLAAKGYGPRPGAVADGSDVVAGGLTPAQRGILNGISSEEAGSYDVLNGGERFEDFTDHPRRVGANGQSTAAGRYQFIAGTWDAATAAYERTYGVKVPDFSPEWQDRVGLFWASKRFDELRGDGPTFDQILASGDREQLLKVKRVLGEPRGDNPNAVEWQGLGPMSDEKFLSIFSGETGLAGGGTPGSSGPDVWTDPRYAGIGLDQKVQLSNSASEATSKAQRDIAAETARVASALKDQAFALGYGSGNLDQLDVLRGQPGFNVAVEQKFRDGVDGYRKKETSIGAVQQKLSTGEPLLAKDQEGLTQWYGEQSFRDLQSGSPAALEKLRYAAGASGMLPDGTVEAMRIAMDSPQGKQPALEFLAQLHSSNPDILVRSGFSDKDIADALVYSRFASRGTAADAMAKFDQMKTNNALPGMEEKMRTAANKYFIENITPATITSISDTALSFEAGKPINPAVEGMMMNDAYMAFADGYALYGNSDAATTYMEESLKRVWTPTSVGVEKQLMRYAPDSGKFAFSVIDGSYGWMNEEMSKQLTGANAARSLPALNPDSGILVGDSQTEQEVRAGKLPTYVLQAISATGEVVVVPGRFGGEDLQRAGEQTIRTKSTQIAVRTEYDQAAMTKAKLDQQIALLENADKMTPRTRALSAPVTSADVARLPELRAESARLATVVAGKQLALTEQQQTTRSLYESGSTSGVPGLSGAEFVTGLDAITAGLTPTQENVGPSMQELVAAATNPDKPVGETGVPVTEQMQFVSIYEKAAPLLRQPRVWKELNSRTRQLMKLEKMPDGAAYTAPSASKRARAEYLARELNIPYNKIFPAIDSAY